MEKYNSYDTETSELQNLPLSYLEERHTQKLLKCLQLMM